MRRSIIVAVICLYICMNAACGTKEAEQPAQLPDQVFVNIHQDLTAQFNEIKDASQKSVYSSFEEVYNEYSDNMGKLYVEQEKELRREIEEGQDGNALAKSYSEMTAMLKELAEDGVSTMSRMAAINPSEDNDYSQWAESLNSQYLAYDQGLNAVYAEGANKK